MIHGRPDKSDTATQAEQSRDKERAEPAHPKAASEGRVCEDGVWRSPSSEEVWHKKEADRAGLDIELYRQFLDAQKHDPNLTIELFLLTTNTEATT